tara:strand:- start:1435 stop:1836 length:402 start_codon:yes stop_codon:yes gene_type:complete
MKELRKINCAFCETSFVQVTTRQKYCSYSCRIKADSRRHRKTRTDWVRENGRKNRKYLQDYKLEKGCNKCGYKKHHAALEFNHLDPKLKSGTIAAHVTNWSLKKLMNEVNKCEVLCANCHRIHTWEELQANKD